NRNAHPGAVRRPGRRCDAAPANAARQAAAVSNVAVPIAVFARSGGLALPLRLCRVALYRTGGGDARCWARGVFHLVARRFDSLTLRNSQDENESFGHYRRLDVVRLSGRPAA